MLKNYIYILFLLLSVLLSNEYSAYFGGNGDKINISDIDNSPLDLSNQGTIMAWIKPDGLTQETWANIVTKSDNGNYGGNLSGISYYLIWRQSDSVIKGVVCDGNSTSGVTMPLLTDEDWHHIAYTFDGQNNSIYLDGILIDSTPQTNSGPQSTNYPLKIGGDAFGNDGGSSDDFKGNIDEVQIWKVALTEIEINYFMGTDVSSINNDLVGYWKFDTTSNATLGIDSSSNDLNGTNTGAELSEDIPQWDEDNNGDFNNTGTQINDIGQSIPITIDLVTPIVTVTSPNNGESYFPGEQIIITWDAYDENIADLPITIFGSLDGLTGNVPFILNEAGDEILYIENTGEFEITQFVNWEQDNGIELTTFFIVYALDTFGNTGFDATDQAVTINEQALDDVEQYVINDFGQSSPITIDLVTPIVTVTSPNNGESYFPGEQIIITWDAYDENIADLPITIFGSLDGLTGNVPFILNEAGDEILYIENTGEFEITQFVNWEQDNGIELTTFFIVYALDTFGNTGFDATDQAVTINEQALDDVEQYVINDFGQSILTLLDAVDPNIFIEYPVVGDQIIDYTQAELSCPSTDDNLNPTGLTIEISFEIGGFFVEVASGLDAFNVSNYPIDLSLNGEIPERIYGLMRATIEDQFGNTNTALSNGYFILGNPTGSANTNYLDQAAGEILLDWSWTENQTIVILEDVISSLQQEGFEYIKIYDQHGYSASNCDEENIFGPIGLYELDIRESSSDEILALSSGFNYCSIGGSIIPGYVEGNSINFVAGSYSNNEEYEMMATINNDYNIIFNNSTLIINSLSPTETTAHFPYHFLSEDSRDWDSFNVYGKVTNHQSNTTLRELNNFGLNRESALKDIDRTRNCNDDGICQEGESLVDCYTDCCSLPGTGENDEWCLLETVEGISNFQDNMNNGNYVPYIPANTSTATINFRVWLLNNNNEEVVKSIDTEINYEASNLYCEGDGDVNGDDLINIVDVVSIIGHILEQFIIEDLVLLCEADLNSDGLVNIIDIVELVDIILQQ